MLVKLSALHHSGWLIAHAAEQQGPPAPVEHVREVLEGMQPCPIDGRHVPEPEDDDLGQGVELTLQIEQLVGAAEEKRPVNTINRDVGRNVLKLEAMGTPMANVPRA